LSAALLAVVWALVVVDLLFRVPATRTPAVVCMVAFLLCVVPRASVHIRLLFLLAAMAAVWSGFVAGDWTPVRRGLEAGTVIGAFFPTIMLLRVTADESPLVRATRERLEGFGERQQELWTQATAHLLGSFLMIGGYLIARAALPADLSEPRRLRIAEAAVIGIGLAVCWSPFFVAGAIAGQLVPTVSAWQLVALGVALSAAGWALSLALLYRGVGAGEVATSLRGVATFAVPSAVLVTVVVFVSIAAGYRSLEAVVLVVPPICVAYLATVGRGAIVRTVRRLPVALGRLSDELIVFTSAMCVGAIVGGSGAGQGVSELLSGLAGVPLLLIGAEVALIAGLGLAGLHPMITVTLLFPLLAEAHARLADVVVAYIVVLGWALSSLAAIWSLPVASAATTFDVPVRRLAVGRNARFALAFGLLGCIALAAVNGALAG
jgi:hypothetical protein